MAEKLTESAVEKVNKISVVVGSWGSYNEGNSRAMGSKWLDLNDFENWEEIAQELEKEGFQLDGIDEELFIQDIEGLPSNCTNWDYCHPKTLFNILKEAEILDDAWKYNILIAYLEARDWGDFVDRVNDCGSNWDDDIYFYEGYDWEDYGREYCEACGYEIPDQLEDFIDFAAYGEYIGQDCAEEVSGGILEIRD